MQMTSTATWKTS